MSGDRSDCGGPFDVLRAVSGSAELTVEANVEPLGRLVEPSTVIEL
mgnify:CR=1 FL=1